MLIKDRLEIIKICKNKSISYNGVTTSFDQFSMRGCDILYEVYCRVKQYTQSGSDID